MDNAALRRTIYSILLALTAGITTARIVAVEFVYEPSIYSFYKRAWPKTTPERSPTFSSNDRSRWAAVRALVEEDTFVIGRRIDDDPLPKGYREQLNGFELALGGSGGVSAALTKSYRDEGFVFRDGYGTVDKMLNPTTHEFYSTKPPLLTLMVAGEYAALRKLFGWTLDDNRWEVVCTTLIIFNLLPLVIYLFLLSRLLEEYGTTDWGRLFVFAAACLGTFLTTFSVTLSNHTPAACCTFFALYPLLRGRSGETGEARPYSLAALLTSGFFAGLATSLDLPAAAFAAALAGLIVLKQRSFVPGIWFAAAAALPAAALLITNYQALGEWNIGYSKFGTPWYEYEGSHWLKGKDPDAKGIDFAREDKLTYGFHLLLGHHGLFSLTPIWLLSLLGMGMALRNLAAGSDGTRVRRSLLSYFNALTVVVALVVIGFYIVGTNNYGGWTSGPRWLFWLTPLFLLALLPAADRLASCRCSRSLALLLLAVSAFSAFYPIWNPWRHPWLYQLCEYMDWINYSK